MRFSAKAEGGIYDPYKIKNPKKQRWDQLLSIFNAKASPGVNNSKQTAGLDWCYMISEINMVETLEQGLIISIGFALLALFIATGNFIVALLAALSIGMIILNVLAMVIYNDWQLGSSECVGVVICVGFAVDYVVHLASHYVHSKHQDSYSRVQESLRELGVSILSGSITTVLAVVVLVICEIIVFLKFAIFVSYTIILSLVYSLGFFTAACHIIGPSGKFGNFNHMYKQAGEWYKFQV